MSINLLNNLKDIELSREKLKDFKNVVLVQIALVLATMVVRNFLSYISIPNADKITESVFFAILGVYVWLLWDMLRNYTKSKVLLIALLILIMGTFMVGLIVVNPFFTLISGYTFRIVTSVIMLTLLLVEVFVIYFTTLEIAKRDLAVEERLFGAACIYLITAFAFGGIYEIMCILDIEQISMNTPLGTMHFMKSISYSIMILGGVNTPYTCSESVANISAIESVWGNLYIVFVVGRLLYK